MLYNIDIRRDTNIFLDVIFIVLIIKIVKKNFIQLLLVI